MQSPAGLLEQARALTPNLDPPVTLDELAAARLAASEDARGPRIVWAVIIDTQLNRTARTGQPLAAALMGSAGRFGRQGSGRRPASTARDPHTGHLEAAIAVLRTGELRGIARGATHFFNPRVQDAMHRKWRRGETSRVHSCSAADLLEAWSFDMPRQERGRRCPPDPSRSGPNTLAWVGPIDGIDPRELLLLAPMAIGAEHLRRTQTAHTLIAP